MPEIRRQCSHCLISEAISRHHEPSHRYSKLCHLLEEFGGSGILQSYATNIQHL